MNPKLDIPEFESRNYATTDDYPDEFEGNPLEEYVRTISANPVEAQQARRDIPLETVSPFDDGVRLNTPENHRRQAVEEIQAALAAAIRHAQASRGWAGAIGYHAEFRDKLSDAIGELQAAADLIDVFEN